MSDEHNDFLRGLRDSGAVNMFGAAPILAEQFEIDIKEARKILSEWMKSF